MADDSERYRKAATDALKMLDWCIFYFRHEGHGEIAARLEQNRAYIRERLTGEPEETLRALPERVNPLRKTLEAIGLKPKTPKRR